MNKVQKFAASVKAKAQEKVMGGADDDDDEDDEDDDED